VLECEKGLSISRGGGKFMQWAMELAKGRRLLRFLYVAEKPALPWPMQWAVPLVN